MRVNLKRKRYIIGSLQVSLVIWWFALMVSSSGQKRTRIRTENFITSENEYWIGNGANFLVKNIETHIDHKPLSRDMEVQPHANHDDDNTEDVSINKDRINFGNNSRNVQDSSRIIGGGEAQKGRYSYIASLTKERTHVCGGSLIADDIILSAAHCGGHFDGVELGRHDVTDQAENFERYNIEKSLKHPNYKDAAGSFDNDFMVIKLYGWSEKQVVRINFNTNSPKNDEDLFVAGWGVVNAATKQSATKLEEVSVNYMTNAVCKTKKNYIPGYPTIFSLQNKISGNMLCAIDSGEDACQGDSGGPLIQKKSSAEYDVQVGVVSWGIGCADEVFPGIYSRISSQYQWIRNIVCAWAENPPDMYACDPVPEMPEKAKRTLTMEIQLDRFPSETGWLIRSQYGKTVSFVGLGVYSEYAGLPKQEKGVITTLQLEEETKYELIMLDAYGDGLKFDQAYYKLWLGDAPYIGIQLISGSFYGKKIIHPFYVPKLETTNTNPPAQQIPSPAPSILATLPEEEEEEEYLTIGFKFDLHPEQIGWAITTVDTQELLISKPFGFYAGKQSSMVFEKFVLPKAAEGESKEYIFAVLDSGRDGMCCEKGQGFFQVFYGDMSDNEIMFRGGTFTYLQQFIFQLDGNVITSPPVYSPRTDGEGGRYPWFGGSTSGVARTQGHCSQLFTTMVALVTIVLCMYLT